MLKMLAIAGLEQAINFYVGLDDVLKTEFANLHPSVLRLQIDSPYVDVCIYFDPDKIRIDWINDQPDLSAYWANGITENKTKPNMVQATATIKATNLANLLKLLQKTGPQLGAATITGQTQLLQKIQQILAKADPNISVKLSPFIGEALAQQIHQTIVSLQQQGKQLIQSAAFTGQDWLKYDSQLLAPRYVVENWMEGVQSLTTNIERLQAKVTQLKKQLPNQQAEQTLQPVSKLGEQHA